MGEDRIGDRVYGNVLGSLLTGALIGGWLLSPSPKRCLGNYLVVHDGSNIKDFVCCGLRIMAVIIE